MLNLPKRVRAVLLIVVALLLIPRSAAAQRAYFNGTMQSNMTACPVTGLFVTVLQSYTGYYTDPNEPYPKTGDLGYVHAVAVNVSPCVNDAAGFDFFLPDGASLAVSPTNPVYCWRGHVNDSYSEAVPNDANGGCGQTPSIGQYNGYFFGWSALPPGWWLEIQVPVVYSKQLLGIAGPTTHRLSVATSSAFGAVFPYQPVTVFYQAGYQSFSSSNITASSATVGFTLLNYYKGGLLYIDYGTTTAFGTTLPGVAIGSTAVSTASTSQLAGLNPSTLYYWRARYVTTDGTFTSATQTFTTTGASAQSLTVQKTGTGTVTSSPPGINCGTTCSASFPYGTAVTLSATPASGWSFSGWSGAGCGGTGTCGVTMSAPRTVTAAFARQLGSLSIAVSGLPASSAVQIGVTGPDGFALSPTIMTGTAINLSDVGTGTYTVTAPSTTAGGKTYSPTAAAQNATVTFGGTATVNVAYTAAVPQALLPAGDFDGDHKADVALFRPAQSAWYLRYSGNGQSVGFSWGTAGDIPVPGDYDGDGKADIAVFRPSDGGWYVAKSSGGMIGVTWGTAGDIPVPADYDGDGKTDMAVFRPSQSAWYILKSGGGVTGVTWGTTGDIPVPADYDGDHKADIGVFRPSDSGWYIVKSTGGGLGVKWGAAGDLPVVGDFDGDGKADVGVFRASQSGWYIVKSSTGGGLGFTWGTAGDVPVFGDFDGDGKADAAVFRPSDGGWYVMKSSGGSMGVFWGAAGDLPV